MALLDEHVDHVIVHTGQNYDYELNGVFWEELELRKPDHFLNSDVSSLGATIGDIIRKSEEVLKLEKPDAVLVLGDTNSCLAAYMAKRMHIPIFHMEAGNRCFDENVPEETNRRIIDHIADFNLVYTEHARRHLLSEGLPHRRIYLTGSPMFEVLNHYKEKILSSRILNNLELEKKRYFIVSIHREENVDSEDNFTKILTTLDILAETYGMPILISTHPRTRKKLEFIGYLQKNKLLQFLVPFGFFEYIKLQANALCVISDSGTITEESSILKFPAIMIRQTHERPEGMDEGTVIMAGLNSTNVVEAINVVVTQSSLKNSIRIISDYEVENVSLKVVRIIISYIEYINRVVWQKLI